jgi:hypothetical protein
VVDRGVIPPTFVQRRSFGVLHEALKVADVKV